ncbi:hypothetical protein O6H91_07G048900 [Diphasiastrum complanatum]|uniref:Uncharacterized protein n=1 Tax=Diphasiastrum complanatum TaxID=34168 RepID=A0ACC2D509_DIPCM|nr:hypothetical protein O6H91_07G048900 [Diphasiastrum complanatum]
MPLFAQNSACFDQPHSPLLQPTTRLPPPFSSSCHLQSSSGLSSIEATTTTASAVMTACSRLPSNSSLPDPQMAEVHLFSVDNTVRSLSNPRSSIASNISPSLTPHDSSYILNSIPEILCGAVEPGAWPQFYPNPHIPFASPVSSLNPISAMALPDMGYLSNDEMVEGALLRELIGRLGSCEFGNGVTSLASDSNEYSFNFGEEDGWRGLDASNNTAFSLDLPKENNSLPAASLGASACLAGTSSDPGYAEYPRNFTLLCNGGLSELEQHCVGTPNIPEPIATGRKPLKAFGSRSKAAESGGRVLQPTYQREEECPEPSYSSGHDAVQNPRTPMKGGGGTAGKKRKTAEDKMMDAPSSNACAEQRIAKPKPEDMKIKGHKSFDSIKAADDTKKKAEPNSSGNSADSSDMHAKVNVKAPEPPKQDFIHVRARRGQATDSHSLAERVRREKISERMKFLQDLVPGCSKVSGKAVMLDEIINYVQSLQHQVEFLSMRLAAVNPRLNCSLDSMFRKEVSQGHITPSPFVFDQELSPNFSLLTSAQAKLNQRGVRCTGGLDSRPLSSTQDILVKRSAALNSDIFRDANSQTSSLWDEQMQNPMQIGF